MWLLGLSLNCHPEMDGFRSSHVSADEKRKATPLCVSLSLRVAPLDAFITGNQKKNLAILGECDRHPRSPDGKMLPGAAEGTVGKPQPGKSIGVF